MFTSPILRKLVAGATPEMAIKTATPLMPAKATVGLIADPDKPIKPSAATYKTQAEVDAANKFARDFSKRHNTLFANESWVAKKPGDPVVQFRTLDGKPYIPKQMPASMIKKTVPDWVTEIKMDDEWKQPYYLDGNDMVFVDKSFYNSPRFIKPTKNK